MSLKDGYKKEPVGETKRFCQFLQLNPETLEQYTYWHRNENIWKEIPEGIKRAGILDMEIYIQGINAVMVLETPVNFNWDEAFGKLATFERQSEWEDFVAQFQQAGAGKRSDEKWQLMERVFSLKDV